MDTGEANVASRVPRMRAHLELPQPHARQQRPGHGVEKVRSHPHGGHSLCDKRGRSAARIQ